jgi:hypothetical protein
MKVPFSDGRIGKGLFVLFCLAIPLCLITILLWPAVPRLGKPPRPLPKDYHLTIVRGHGDVWWLYEGPVEFVQATSQDSMAVTMRRVLAMVCPKDETGRPDVFVRIKPLNASSIAGRNQMIKEFKLNLRPLHGNPKGLYADVGDDLEIWVYPSGGGCCVEYVTISNL